jgi:O-antigen ligase
MYFDPGEAHNGYLDILNELGFIGILALIGYITTFLRQSIFLLAFNRQKSALFIGLLFAQLIANMSEAHWWRISSVNFYIMTLATFDLARSVMEAKQKKRGGNARSVQSRAQPLNRTTVPGRRYSVDAPPLHSKTP